MGVRRGVTLIEMVLVLVLLALVAGLSITAVGVDGGAGRELGERVMTRLLEARHEAMRSGAPARAVVEVDEEGYRVWVEARGEEIRSRSGSLGAGVLELWDRTADYGLGGAVASGERGRLEAEFRPSGRTDRRSWRLGVRGRMWDIEFDPVTGEPSLARGSAE